MWIEIAQKIARATGQDFTIADRQSVRGGCINQGYRVKGKQAQYFVKLNDGNLAEMFVAEALGLKQMLATQTIIVPKPVCWGTVDNNSYIVLQWLDLGGRGDRAWTEMGHQLAAMHRQGKGSQFLTQSLMGKTPQTALHRFGWEINNTIGSTPQVNTWMDNWADFFAEQRIGYQLKLAQRRGGSFPDLNRVVEAVRSKLANRQPQASLLHGDLWSGNAAFTSDGQPVIFDPATYYGDREADIAMTELFGGFPTAFYNGYNEAWQLDAGYSERKSIYNLYHVLNHFNLFGGGYGNQAKRIIEGLI